MLSIPVLKGLMRSLDHKKGPAEAVATTGPDAEYGADFQGASHLASLAAYLQLDVLAIIEVPPGAKTAEITAAGRTGLATSLTMPLAEDKGTLARLVAAAKPRGGRDKVFVTSQIFPRDGNWCDFLPLDSSLAFFFVPARTLPAAANRCSAGRDLFVLAADLTLEEPDHALELKTYLAAGLVLLSAGRDQCLRYPEIVRACEHFLKAQDYRVCLADDRGNPVDWDGRPSSGQGDAGLNPAIKQFVRELPHACETPGEPRQIALGAAGGSKAYAYPISVPSGHPVYLVLAGPGRRPEDTDLRKEWLGLLGRFTSSIAHEIKNPLTGIAAGVQYLAKRLQPGVVEADTVDFILAEIARLNRIVDDLYKIARPPQLVLKSASINDVVAKSLFCLSEEIVKKRLNLVQRLSNQAPAFQCDPERLQQVLLNVIKNAIEASPDGGQIEVATGFAEGRITVSVKDGGRGVPEADRGKIFEPFFSTKKGGTGLGLCISQAIISEHGGKMWLETPPEGGAVFVIDLPVEIGHGQSTDR